MEPCVPGGAELAGSGSGRGSARPPERFADPDAAWREGRSEEGGPSGAAARSGCPGLTPARSCPVRGLGYAPLGGPSPWTAPAGWATRPAPPRPAEPPPAPPLRTRVDRTPDPGPRRAQPRGPQPCPGDGRRPQDPGRERRTETLGVGTPWAAALAPTAPTWAARIASRRPAPPPARPRVSPGPGLGRGAGVGLRGKPRVRGARGGELPPLPVVPERPRPPPPYRSAAPAGPRPAPAHWLRRARCRLRGPGAAADPLSALCLPLARRPPPLSAPRADPALRTAPPASRSPASRNPPPRRPALDQGRGRSRRVRAGGLGAGTSTGGDDSADKRRSRRGGAKDNWAPLAFGCFHFPAPWALPPSPRGSHAPSDAEMAGAAGHAIPPQGGPWGPPGPPALSPCWRPAACACGARCSGPREAAVPKGLWGPTL